MRVAIFFTPPTGHGLTAAAASWLGRDAFTGSALPQASVPAFSAGEIRDLTAFPRRYGFHATMKPPFRIADGHTLAEIETALESWSRDLAPVRIPALHIERIGSFFALTPRAPVAAIDALAAAAVEHFDAFRAPATADEIGRRRPESLTASQRQNLGRWGYPYVFDDYRFHMTLTGEVPDAYRDRMARILEERFAAAMAEPLVVDSLSLFVESPPPGDFVVRFTAPIGRSAKPMDAA